MMDAITGLSGAAPAYVFLILEALTDGAVAAGLPREQALPLATQTLFGSARMVCCLSCHGAEMCQCLPAVGREGMRITGCLTSMAILIRGAVNASVRACAHVCVVGIVQGLLCAMPRHEISHQSSRQWRPAVSCPGTAGPYPRCMGRCTRHQEMAA